MLARRPSPIIPMVLMVIGLITMFVGIGTIYEPLAMVRVETGPTAVTIGGVPAITATLIGTGAIIFLAGFFLWILMMRMR